MKRIIFLLGLSFLSYSKKITHLTGTNWKCKIAKNCINTYKFNPSGDYTFSSCEMNRKYYGKYYFIKDTLFLFVEYKINETSNDYPVRLLYKSFIKNDSLIHFNVSDWSWLKKSG